MFSVGNLNTYDVFISFLFQCLGCIKAEEISAARVKTSEKRVSMSRKIN